MVDPGTLHKWVTLYNWDDGLAPIWPIVESTKTEYATVLLIYWRMEGPFSTATSDGVNAEAKRLLDLVTERLLSGFYRKGSLHYDPVADNKLSKTQIYQLKKAGLPDELIQPEYPPQANTA